MEQRYNNHMDLQQIYDYCELHGETVTYNPGERLEEEGKTAQWFAFVKKGHFKYIAHDLNDNSEHIAWFSLEDEIVASYPNLLYGRPSYFTIEAITPSTVLRVSSERINDFFNQSVETMSLRIHLSEHLLTQFQNRYMDFYRATPPERYKLLLERCPGIVNELSLQDIASYLNVTPSYLSIIRKNITFEEKK